MSRPIIFISHSAKEPEAIAARAAVISALDDARCRVRVDLDLEGGDDWRRRIAQDMDECESAIVLISPAALSSLYVHSEVAVLRQRLHQSDNRGDDPPFVLIPLLVGVTRDELRKSPLNSTRLTDLQTLTWPADVPGGILAALPLINDADDRERPDHALQVKIAQDLVRATLAPETIRAVGEKLGVPLAALRDRREKALARGLLDAEHDVQLSGLLELKRLTTDAQLAHALYDNVAPHALVSAEAAGVVRLRTQAPEGERGAGINCTNGLIPQLYVKRANFQWSAIEVGRTWSDDFAAEILEDVYASVAERLGYRGSPPGPDVLNSRLAERPAFLLLPYPIPSKTLVGELRGQLGNLVLIMRCKSADELTAARVQGVEYVRPELDDGAEPALVAMMESANLDLNST